jgi:Ni/Co efflux regulator RcnB
LHTFATIPEVYGLSWRVSKSESRETIMKSAFLLPVLCGVLLVSVLGSTPAIAQDDASAQFNHQFNEQVTRSNEEDRQRAEDNERQVDAEWAREDQAASSIGPITSPPKVSVKTGKVQPGTKVSLTCSTSSAVIYYTTTGWSPTISSRRYTGPITIYATTHLQAIAAAPGMSYSARTNANYTVNGPAVPVFPLILASDGVLHAKTRLHLATGSTTSSKNAKVGDKINILLDQDVKVGDAVVIPKGTPVDAAITIADHSATIGRPGDIAFEVHSLTVNGTTITLRGGERLNGVDHTIRAVFMWVSLVGSIPAVMIHGGDVEITPGMKFTVAVTADTPLLPSAHVAMNRP